VPPHKPGNLTNLFPDYFHVAICISLFGTLGDMQLINARLQPQFHFVFMLHSTTAAMITSLQMDASSVQDKNKDKFFGLETRFIDCFSSKVPNSHIIFTRECALYY
jgi:hypothetical protein